MKKYLAAVALIAAAVMPAQAQTEIQWWHSMDGALNDWVNDLAKQFNLNFGKDEKGVKKSTERPWIR